MKLKFTALLAILILLPAMLFAVPVVITWEWLLEDPSHNLPIPDRFGETGRLITVDSSVTSYTERGLDGTVDHTLYLQQSYDGIHFSEAPIGKAEAMILHRSRKPLSRSLLHLSRFTCSLSASTGSTCARGQESRTGCHPAQGPEGEGAEPLLHEAGNQSGV